MHSIAEQLKKWERRLAEAGIDCAYVESEWIYCHVAGKSRGELLLEQREPCSESLIAAGDAIVSRRITREPLQYILGQAPFMDFELEVTPSVLIPRPETEILVERLIERLPRGATLLDVGTGSGAIALATAYARHDIRVVALDVSENALALAARNRARYGLESRVELRRSDLLSAIGAVERFDAIAANLPYVTEAEYMELEPEVRDHEPKLALTAPDEGLALILRLAATAPPCLKPGGEIIFELGVRQAARLSGAMEAAGKWHSIRVIPDYNGFDRFLTAALS